MGNEYSDTLQIIYLSMQWDKTSNLVCFLLKLGYCLEFTLSTLFLLIFTLITLNKQNMFKGAKVAST